LSFFKAPDYDINVAKYADEHKQPFSISEVVTGQLANIVAKEFNGAVMVRIQFLLLGWQQLTSSLYIGYSRAV
jgi:hypothetical protein